MTIIIILCTVQTILIIYNYKLVVLWNSLDDLTNATESELDD